MSVPFVCVRGNEKKNIFNDEEDEKHFIEILGEKKQEGEFYLPAFCLMNNHVHLMLKEGTEDVSTSIKGEKWDSLIKEFKTKTGLSIRKIASIAEVNKDSINKILKT